MESAETVSNMPDVDEMNSDHEMVSTSNLHENDLTLVPETSNLKREIEVIDLSSEDEDIKPFKKLRIKSSHELNLQAAAQAAYEPMVERLEHALEKFLTNFFNKNAEKCKI